MIPVTQAGEDCFAAAVASILELPLEAVPPFRPDIDWLPEWQEFLLKRNLFYTRCPIDPTCKAVPPGWSILICRCTEDNSGNGVLDWQRHAIVCRNGKPIWEPNGYHLPDSWDGYIKSRRWQVVEPVAWIVFVTLDPTLALSSVKPENMLPYAQLVAESSELLETLRQRTRPYRPGLDRFRFENHADKIISAYMDAPSDEEGERAMLKVVRELTRRCANQADTSTRGAVTL